MNKIIKEELTFTAMMVFGMVLIMLSYNSILAAGFTAQALHIIAIAFVPTYILAFAVEQFVVSHNVHKIHKIIVSSTDHQFKHVVVFALLFVTFMAGIMSLYGTLISTGTENAFWYHYGMNFVRNWPVALVAQLAVVGPLVRIIHMTIFAKSKLVR